MGRAVALVFLAASLIGCGGQAPATPAPSTGATAGPTSGATAPVGSSSLAPTLPATSASPAPSGSPNPSGTPDGPLVPESAVRVTVAELNVREYPSTSAKRVGTVKKGTLFALLGWGPVSANGYVWFQAIQVRSVAGQLVPLPEYPIGSGGATAQYGWIATGDATHVYVERLDPRCPSTVDLANVQGMLAAERLACFGGSTIVLDGTFGCGGCGGVSVGVFSPAWLADPEFDFLSTNPETQLGPFALHFPPTMARPDAAQILRVRGHVGDGRAAECAIAVPTGPEASPVPIAPASAELYCLQRFVVESYEVLGVDPDFPFG
jgi:hypothetical protein